MFVSSMPQEMVERLARKPSFSAGDDIYLLGKGFGKIISHDDSYVVQFEDGSIVDYETSEHFAIAHFDTLEEAHKYNECYTPFAIGYCECMSREAAFATNTKENLLVVLGFYDDNPLELPLLLVFRNELDSINFIGISVSLTEAKYVPYWKMTDKFTKDELDEFIKILTTTLRSGINTWQYAVNKWNELFDDEPERLIHVESMPDYSILECK